MAKLPDNFVKAPVKAPAETSRVTTAKPAGKEVRRKVKRGVLQPPVEITEQSEVGGGDPAGSQAHGVLVQLSPEEHQALSAACEALAAVGETVTIEDMIRKVVGRWMAATRTAAAPEAVAAEANPSAPAVPPRAIDAIRAQLRWLAEQPVRRWRELRQALQRWSRALAG